MKRKIIWYHLNKKQMKGYAFHRQFRKVTKSKSLFPDDDTFKKVF